MAERQRWSQRWIGMKTHVCEDCGNELFFPQRIVTNGQLKRLCFYCCLKYVSQNNQRPLKA